MARVSQSASLATSIALTTFSEFPLPLTIMSRSGNSENVVRAIDVANDLGCETLAICGYDGGKVKKIAKHSLHIKSFDMQLCEDAHFMFGHMVMKRLCGDSISN